MSAEVPKNVVTQGFKFFRESRNQCSNIFDICAKKGWKRVALHGLTDITEIAVLCAANNDIEIIGIIDNSSSMKEYNHIPIVKEFFQLINSDAIIITNLGDLGLTELQCWGRCFDGTR